jgi:hypothetical protein
MTTQEENEAICERLLGWTRVDQVRHPEPFRWITATLNETGDQFIRSLSAPSFDTWADAGLILDAMGRDHHIDFGKNSHGNGRWFCAFEDTSNTPVGEDYAETGPLAIRAAAIEYIQSLEKTP